MRSFCSVKSSTTFLNVILFYRMLPRNKLDSFIKNPAKRILILFSLGLKQEMVELAVYIYFIIYNYN